MTDYLIWSNQHGLWWRAAKRGYTDNIEEAGRYDVAEAKDIVAVATVNGQIKHQRVDPVTGQAYEQYDEVMVLAPEDIDA